MIVSKPEAVSIEQFEESDGTVVLELSVDDEDYGRVIGRGPVSGRGSSISPALIEACSRKAAASAALPA